jgi:hypothetical protein
MPRKKKNETDQPGLLEARVSTAPCVPGIRDKVKAWRDGGYKGTTDTTRLLLNHFFCNDHRLSNGGNEPDFVGLTNDGTHHIVETKGLEDVNVANKDRAAKLWCENTSRLTGNAWDYVKVLQTEYENLQATQFADLLVLAGRQLL